ncbi:MAG: tryptophan synthase subunit alpha [Rhodothermales bacterium]|nr:tryptophan synthase subunit alpha [Rhodothermales bacterium]MBO6779661.1 tryptophan synthase subunit alpha [Rhodothermales bacterium]
MASRITERIRRTNAAGKRAMGIFVTSGFPRPEVTVEVLRAIDAGDADFIELGMPFSDPLAEGLPIQRSSEMALAAGASMKSTLEAARAFRAESDTPLLLMGYLNPVLRFGLSNFFDTAASCGVDGLILPDLPPSERALVSEHADRVGMDIVHLIAPNTPEDRVRQVDSLSGGFVYAVSITGLTGTGHGQREAVNAYLKRSRELVTRNPLLVGFGISSHEAAMELSAHTDGFIVGSAVIRLVEEVYGDESLDAGERQGRIARFVRGLKHGQV